MNPGHETAPSEAQATSQTVVQSLIDAGVQHVVLCPGSRSAPLAYALDEAERQGLLRLHVRLDERSAGFHALGLSIGSQVAGQGAVRAAAVVTTSGTAVANLHPAVLEASHSRVPLVVISADRPHHLRGTGANQTTNQVGIFADAVRRGIDVPAGMPGLAPQLARALVAAHGGRGTTPGPVHINVALREPLVPQAPWELHPAPAVPRPTPAGPATLELPAGRRTVVIAGDRAGQEAGQLAASGAWPLLAEPSSGVRHLPHAVPAYRTLLAAQGLGTQVARVVVLGHPTLSRPVSALLAREDVEVIVVDRHQEWTDVAGTARSVVDAVRVTGAPSEDDQAWAVRWHRVGCAVAQHLESPDTTGPSEVDPVVLAAQVWAGTGPQTALVIGSSNAVRDCDLSARGGGPRAVVANRGLAGIDGTIATAFGVSQSSGRPTRVLLGDLTYLHDVASLAVGELEAEPDVQIIVGDDHGGGIFTTLEYGDAAEQRDRQRQFERLFATPQAAELAGIARAFGVRARVVTGQELAAALREPIRGRSVLVVRTDRSNRRAARASLAEAVRRACDASS